MQKGIVGMGNNLCNFSHRRKELQRGTRESDKKNDFRIIDTFHKYNHSAYSKQRKVSEIGAEF